MSKWTIYTKEGVERKESVTGFEEDGNVVVVDSLEYTGTWMGECFVSATIKSAYPINFQIGDYIDYRDERFTLNYDPALIKKARRGTYGEGFVYDSVKFNARHTELTDIRFLDYVLNDNKQHWTSLPDFPFYAATIDDFCDRLQANTNRWCSDNGIAADDGWLFVTPNRERTMARADASSMSQGEVMRRYREAYGDDGKSLDTTDEKTDVSVTISDKSVWDALAMIKNDFGLNFINRGRSVIIGSAGIPTKKIFRYGKGKGLYEIERTADTDQQIITKLFGYGSSKNLPVRYYANINLEPYANITAVDEATMTTDIPWQEANIFGTQTQSGYHRVKLEYNGTTYKSVTVGNKPTASGNFMAIIRIYNPTLPEFPVGARLEFTGGINPDGWPAGKRTGESDLPNNMAVNRLMLPGFPSTSLYDWVKASGSSANCNDATGYAEWTYDGTTYKAYFSKDKHDPYVLSVNSEVLGIREGVKTFDGSDGDEEVYPTIQGTGFDKLSSAETIRDNGVFAEGEDEPTVTITLPALEFDLAEQASIGDSPTIAMKTGYCGAREFQMLTDSNGDYRVTKNAAGLWECVCKREYDSLLDLWFPYSYAVSQGGSPTPDEPYQLRGSSIGGYAGDQYVLTGIPMTDFYISKASERLLARTLEALAKNDYARYTYAPKVDEIFMARDHQESVAANRKSIYQTIKEGDLMDFSDAEDFGLDEAMIFIDTLNIKENGNADIPTFDITLRNDKQVGAIQRLQEQINSMSSTSSTTIVKTGGGGGVSTKQIDARIEAYGGENFLSKIKDDVAQGFLTFTKGFRSLGDSFVEGILTATGAIIDSIKSSNYTGDSMMDTGWSITNSYKGHSKMTVDELYVRMKAVFESLEIKKRTVTGGDETWSSAANIIVRTDYYSSDDDNDTVIGYSDAKVPWLLRSVSMMLGKNLSDLSNFKSLTRTMKVKTTLTEEQLLEVRRVRCYFLAEDSDGNAVENMWQKDDLVRCQTFNLSAQTRDGGVNPQNPPSESGGIYTRAKNTFWWRKVDAVSSSPVTIGDKKYHYFDVKVDLEAEARANGNTTWCASGSDVPSAGDHACQFGNTSNEERMNAISIEINGSGNADAPCIKAYRGIYTFDFTKCWWGGESTMKMKLSAATGFKFYGPMFEFITEYGRKRLPVYRGLWTDVPFERDDYSEVEGYEPYAYSDDADGTHRRNNLPLTYVRKCYYYDQVTHSGSLWLCSIADGYHWIVDSSLMEGFTYNGVTYSPGDFVPDTVYDSMRLSSSENVDKCVRTANYTIEEPSESSTDWTKQVSRGGEGTSGNSSISVYKWHLSGYEAPEIDKNGGYPPTGWSKTAPDRPDDGYYLWMSQSFLHSDGTVDPWSDPVRISGDKGTAGEDANDMEYIYILKTSETTFDDVTHPANITKDKDGVERTAEYIATTNDFVPYGWSDSPQSIDPTNKFEYYSSREKEKGSDRWGAFSDPIVWSHWGHNGMDGDGVEYVFIRTNSDVAPSIVVKEDNYKDSNNRTYLDDEFRPVATGGTLEATETECSDDPIGVDVNNKYEWVSKRTKGAPDASTGVRTWEKYSGSMSLWATYAQNITKKSETYRYGTSTQGTDPTQVTNWSSERPTVWAVGEFLWTETTITWSDDSTTVLYQAERNPNDGLPGMEIIVDRQVLEYSKKDTQVSDPSTITDYSTTYPTLDKGDWLYTRTTVYYKHTDGTSAGTTVSYNASYIGMDGDGRGIKRVTEHYKASVNATGETTPTTDADEWETTPNPSDWGADKKYLWNYEKITYSDSTSERTPAGVVAIFTEDGRGLDSITDYYLATTKSTGVTREDTGWKTSVQPISANEPYLWNYEKLAWIPKGGGDLEYTYTDPQLIGHWGKDGASAPYYFQEWFAWSNVESTASVTTSPFTEPYAGWSESIPDSGGLAYLWRKSVRYVWNNTTKVYDAEAAQYFRMSGTNGTSIKTKGKIVSIVESGGSLPTTGISTNDLGIIETDRKPYKWNGTSWSQSGMSDADDGDCYVVSKSCTFHGSDVNGHLVMYSLEAGVWIDLGPFKGEPGQTYYTHIAWATDVKYSGTTVTEVTDFSIAKSPNDTTLVWMGVLVDTNPDQDSTNALLYTWSYVVGPEGKEGKEGQKGADGYGLIINPPQVVFEESYNENTGEASINLSSITPTIQLKTGNSTIAINYSDKTDYGCTTTIDGKNSPTLTITFTSISSNITEGYVQLTVTSVNNEFSQTVKVPFFVNRLGTLARTIVAGVESVFGQQTVYTPSGMGEIIKQAYTADIETSAKGFRQEFTEQVSKAGDYNNNLFGFHNGANMTNTSYPTIPFVQGYGIAIKTDYSSKGRITNLGLEGVGGYFAVSFSARIAYGSCTIGVSMCEVSPLTEGSSSLSISSSWSNYTLYFYLPQNTQYMDTNTYNGYIDFYNMTADMYIRHLKIERGNMATDFCEADEDIAYMGGGNLISNITADSSLSYISASGSIKDVYISGSITPSSWSTDYVDYLYKNNSFNLKTGSVYTLSFWAYGSVSGMKIRHYLYSSYDIIEDVSDNIYEYSYSGTTTEGIKSNGCTITKLSTGWNQYFVRFYIEGYASSASLIALRILKSDYGSGSYSFSIGDIQLQEGYVMSDSSFSSLIEQNARRITLTQQTGLKNAGINIENGVIDLTAGKVNFVDPNGNANTKVSIDPSTGTLKAVDGVFEGSLFFHKTLVEQTQDYLALAWNDTTVHTSLKADIFIINYNYSTFQISFPPAYLFKGAEIRIFVNLDITYEMSVTRLSGEEAMTPPDAQSAGWPPYNCFYAATPVYSYNSTSLVYGRQESLQFSNGTYHSLTFISTQVPEGITDPSGNIYYVWMLIDAK